MLLKVEVTSEIQLGGKQTEYGPAKTRQVAYLHGLSAYPDKWVMRYDHTIKPIEPGEYMLGAGSFQMGKYGPEISKPVLVPVAEAAKMLADMVATKTAGRIAA